MTDKNEIKATENKQITQQELEGYLWGAAVLLRGVIDAGDYKQFIFPLLFFKRTSDVYDEEYQKALEESGGDAEYAAFVENHRFQVPKGAHWRDARAASQSIGQSIQNAIRAIEQANPDKLYGIFGDAEWTNKDRLTDETLKNLIEHFSKITLSVVAVPEDELGQGYEYLIKKFADDSGHTAQEFYTNRTLIRLMTLMLEPKTGESVYDPTCGSGGMLLSTAVDLKRQGKEYRTLKLYGQELNLITSSIARMNLFLHDIEDFEIARGDTLSQPKILEDDKLKQFNIVLANPPYSIKQWDREAFSADPYGRNIWGTPPQGRADYAFFQHIVKSMKPGSGRCAILFPHGVLFRNEEKAMREKMIQSDVVECVLGLGPNLFYNSPMEACVVICRMNKTEEQKGKILFIDAVNEVTRRNAQSYLEEDHIQNINNAYHDFIKKADVVDKEGFAKVVSNKELETNEWNMSIPLYVKRSVPDKHGTTNVMSLEESLSSWKDGSGSIEKTAEEFFASLKGLPNGK